MVSVLKIKKLIETLSLLFFMIANISDEASAYVRAFKQKIIAPAVEDDDYTENDEDFVHLNTNASDGVPFQLDSLDYENDEEEVTDEIFRDLADEINEDDADIQEIMQDGLLLS
jgi:hypothetical protein